MKSKRTILVWEVLIDLRFGVLDGCMTERKLWRKKARLYINEGRHFTKGGSLVLDGIAMLLMHGFFLACKNLPNNGRAEAGRKSSMARSSGSLLWWQYSRKCTIEKQESSAFISK